MKKLLLGLACMIFAFGLSAQANEKAKDPKVQAATDEMVALYNLDEQQTEKMYVIQERHQRNLSEIAAYESQDPQLYLKKKRSVRDGLEGSIKRILNEEQMKTFHAQILERRKKESELIKQLRANGASKEEIQMALLGVE